MTEHNGWNRVSLANLANGAAVELFDSALAEVHSNILDPNTDQTKVREVHLTVRLLPDKKDPKKIGYDLKVTKKLAPHPGVSNIMYIGTEGGGVVGYEQEGFQNPLPGMNSEKILNFKNHADGG